MQQTLRLLIWPGCGVHGNSSFGALLLFFGIWLAEAGCVDAKMSQHGRNILLPHVWAFSSEAGTIAAIPWAFLHPSRWPGQVLPTPLAEGGKTKL